MSTPADSWPIRGTRVTEHQEKPERESGATPIVSPRKWGIVLGMQKTAQSNRIEVADRSDDGKEITITIAYDEKSAGQRAARLFALIGQEQAEQWNIAVQPWRFDLLADPDWQSFAVADALHADILVIAISNPANLSAAVEQWFKTWLDGKRGLHAAVIVLLETESDIASFHSPKLEFLESATKEAGLDFFSPRPDCHAPAWEFNPVPPQAFSCRRPYRHWGINE